MADQTAYGPTPSVALADYQAIMDQGPLTIQYANATGTDVAAGGVVLIGTVPMVAVEAIPTGTTGTLTFVGQVNIVKDSSAPSQGDAAYWNATGNPVGRVAGTGCVTTTASGAYLMGFFAAAAVAGDARAKVQMTAAKRTATVAGSATADDITGSDASLGIAGAAGVGAGTGGAVVIAGGASAGGTGTAGAVTIAAGAATGGTGAAVNIGLTNTTAVNIAAASIPTVINGPMTRGVGASTAGFGTTYADAAALPAGTAGVYPTTGADDQRQGDGPCAPHRQRREQQNPQGLRAFGCRHQRRGCQRRLLQRLGQGRDDRLPEWHGQHLARVVV